jgi:glycosyltransferase involved in cell wall biosynthesis
MEQGKKIVMMANAGHRPFDTRIFLKEARSLAQAGFDVNLVIPTDKDEERDGVKIVSVPRHPKGWKKLVVSPWLVYKRAMKFSRDAVYHLHDSELLWVGVLMKLRGRKLIYDAHEDTPLQITYQHWIPKLLRKPYGWFYYLLEKLCGRWFDAIIVAEPVITKYFPPSKTTLIRNFPIAARFPEPAHSYTSRSNKIIYAGLLSRPRGTVEMAEASKIAKEHSVFNMIFAGDFSPASLRDEIVGKYPVEYIPWMDFNALVDLMMDSRAGLIVPQSIERYNTNYPIKTFEYMIAAMPVIASKHGESARFVLEADAGIVVEPKNPTEIADAIRWILDHPEEASEMGKRGRQLILSKYTWEEESKTLINLYQKI